MSDQKGVRLSKLAKEFNVGITTIVDFLKKKGHDVENNPNTKISEDLVKILEKEYSSEISVKKESEKLNLREFRDKKETITLQDVKKRPIDEDDQDIEEETIKDVRLRAILHETEEPKEKIEIKVVGKIDISTPKKTPKPEPVKEEKIQEQIPEPAPVKKKTKEVHEKVELKAEPKAVHKAEVIEHIATEKPEEIEQPKVVGRIDLDSMNLRTRPPKRSYKEREAERKQSEKDIKKRLAAEQPAVEENEEAIPVKEKQKAEKSEDHVIRAKAGKLAGPNSSWQN